LEIEMQEQPNVHLAQTDGDAAAARSADLRLAHALELLRLLTQKGVMQETGLRWSQRLVMAREFLAGAQPPEDAVHAAARRLLAAVDEQHATKDAPLKYTAPWGAIADLRAALAASSGDANASA
jgi:hypothetical protein